MLVCMSMHQQQSNLIVVLAVAATSGSRHLRRYWLRHCWTSLMAGTSSASLQMMYVVSRVHLGIFTPRLDRVDMRVQNNPSYYLLTISSSSSLQPICCRHPHSCCSVFEENVIVMRILQLLYLQMNHCPRTTVVYTWFQGHDTRTIVVYILSALPIGGLINVTMHGSDAILV